MSIKRARFSALLLLAGVLSLMPCLAQSVPNAGARAKLRTEIGEIARATHGPVGAAVCIVEGGPVVPLHGEQRFPMQSVYKLPIGMALLHQVDLGKLSLVQPVQIRQSDLVPPSRGSPIRDKYPHGTTMTVLQLLQYMMNVSDGTASDILLHLAGGPEQVTAYVHGLGIRGIVVATSERAMAGSERVQYRNWATPDAMVRLLCALQQGRNLSVPSRRLLLGLMTGTAVGPDRIKGLLPAGTVVAHKTGSSGTVNGLTRATNDVGLIALPDGRHLAVAVFVSDTQASDTLQARVIAKIARAAWDCRAALQTEGLTAR